MSVPAVSVALHEHYTPEIRDRILGTLRASMGEPSYRMLTPAHLRALAEISSPAAPVLSLYLQLDPGRRAGGAWQSGFASLATAALKRTSNRREREAMKDEFDRIESVLHGELPTLGRGVVFFVCRPMGLWRQIAVSVPLPDGLYFGARPHIRPLVRTRDEHDRFVLLLLSQERSRFFISQIGQVEEVFQVRGQSIRRVLADRTARTSRDGLATDATESEARLFAHVAELVVKQFEGRYLLVSGPPALRAAFLENLSKEMRHCVSGTFAVDIHAGPSEVAAAAESAQRAIEEREEITTLTRMIEAGPQGSAWGESLTLAALRDRRVMTLVVDDIFAKPGARCGNCGGLWDTISDNCPACGSNALEAVEDIVEVAIEEALKQRSALELVRSDPARRLMSDRGVMAALLRW
jgi:peptide subunit release factor 1 (eRF1)